jgi:hypothetical protein
MASRAAPSAAGRRSPADPVGVNDLARLYEKPLTGGTVEFGASAPSPDGVCPLPSPAPRPSARPPGGADGSRWQQVADPWRRTADDTEGLEPMSGRLGADARNSTIPPLGGSKDLLGHPLRYVPRRVLTTRDRSVGSNSLGEGTVRGHSGSGLKSMKRPGDGRDSEREARVPPTREGVRGGHPGGGRSARPGGEGAAGGPQAAPMRPMLRHVSHVSHEIVIRRMWGWCPVAVEWDSTDG